MHGTRVRAVAAPRDQQQRRVERLAMSVGAVEVHERQALVSLRDTVLQTGRDSEILHLHRE
ncbi:MAG: hypothetical protein M3Y17_05100, partial [Actinomycetota bacterium]|nr:hypothetical protein [Actinomycetota bacterium]